MKKSIIVLGVGASVALFSILSCKKENKESVAPSCDTAKVAYSEVSKIFTDYGCNGCHKELASESGAKSFDLKDGIEGSLKHEKGYAAMPNSSTKLSDCEINKIVAWYHQNP